jgi:hypothetical protein
MTIFKDLYNIYIIMSYYISDLETEYMEKKEREIDLFYKEEMKRKLDEIKKEIECRYVNEDSDREERFNRLLKYDEERLKIIVQDNETSIKSILENDFSSNEEVESIVLSLKNLLANRESENNRIKIEREISIESEIASVYEGIEKEIKSLRAEAIVRLALDVIERIQTRVEAENFAMDKLSVKAEINALLRADADAKADIEARMRATANALKRAEARAI